MSSIQILKDTKTPRSPSSETPDFDFRVRPAHVKLNAIFPGQYRGCCRVSGDSFICDRCTRPSSHQTPQDFEGADDTPKDEVDENAERASDDLASDWTTREVNRIARMEKAPPPDRDALARARARTRARSRTQSPPHPPRAGVGCPSRAAARRRPRHRPLRRARRRRGSRSAAARCSPKSR